MNPWVQSFGRTVFTARPVGMRHIFAGVLALVALTSAVATAIILTDRIEATVHDALEVRLAAGVRARMAQIGAQMERRIEQHKEHMLNRAAQSFENEKLAIADGLVSALLPMVENFDLEAVEEIARETLGDTENLKGIRIRTARQGPWQQFGTPEHQPGRSFRAVGKSRFGYVEVQMHYDIAPLTTILDAEAEAVSELLTQYQVATRDTVGAIQQQTQAVERTLSHTSRWWIGLATGVSAGLLTALVLLLLDWLVIRPLRDAVQLLGQIAEGGVIEEPSGYEAVSAPTATVDTTAISWLRDQMGWTAAWTRELVDTAEQMAAILSDRKQAEARVRRSLDVAQTILDTAPVGMAIVGRDRIVHRINAAALEMVGKKREEVVGEVCNHMMCSAREGRCPVLGNSAGRETSETVVCGPGGEIPILKTVVPIKLHDEPAFLEAFFDISERKRAEVALVDARQQAEAASRAKSAFLANMSHEIRTPMNGVLGMAELLGGTSLTSEQRRFTDAIQHSGEALVNIINDILDFSKIEAGKLDLEQVSFDLRGLVMNIEELMGESARTKGLEFGCIVAGDMPLTYLGDPVRLRQILVNLVGNAIKFTDRGQVELRVRCLEEGSGDALLRFEVCDTGIGISEEAKVSLFEAFAQADPSTTRRFGGTGLGLTISKRLVGMMQGEIGVEGELGSGSTFWFAVRLSQGDASATVAPARSALGPPSTQGVPEQQTPSFRARVLVAEDHSVNQEVVSLMLRLLGCEVVVVEDGRGALEALSRREYDLVLMDCAMPHMDGYETTAEIRRRERETGGGSVAVIALTANALLGDRERCLAVGMDDYLSKPVAIDELRRMLKRWLPSSLAQVGDTAWANGPVQVRSDRDVPEQGGRPPLDSQVLAGICSLDTGDNGEFLRSLAEKYADNWTRDFAALQASIHQGNAESARKMAHRLKSSSANLGALPLAKLCQQLESALGASRLEGHEDLMARMTEEHERVNLALSKEWEAAA